MNQNDFIFLSFKMTDFMHGPGTGKNLIFQCNDETIKRFFPSDGPAYLKTEKISSGE